MNLWTATSCLPLLAAAFALWYRRNAETRVPLTSPGKLEKDVSVPAWGRVMGRDAMRKVAQGRARSSFSPKRCPIWRRERGARAGSGPQTAGSAMSTGRDVPSLLTSRSARASMSSPRRRDSSHASTQPGLASETASSSTRFPGMPLRCARGSGGRPWAPRCAYHASRRSLGFVRCGTKGLGRVGASRRARKRSASGVDHRMRRNNTRPGWRLLHRVFSRFPSRPTGVVRPKPHARRVAPLHSTRAPTTERHGQAPRLGSGRHHRVRALHRPEGHEGFAGASGRRRQLSVGLRPAGGLHPELRVRGPKGGRGAEQDDNLRRRAVDAGGGRERPAGSSRRSAEEHHRAAGQAVAHLVRRARGG